MNDKNARIFKLEIESDGSSDVLVDPFLRGCDENSPKSSVSFDNNSVSVTLTIPFTEENKEAIEELREGRFTIAVILEDPESDDSPDNQIQSRMQTLEGGTVKKYRKKRGYACTPDGVGGHICFP